MGTSIATALLKHGVTVVGGARDPTSPKTQAAVASLPGLKVVSIAEAVQGADFVFLTTPYDAVKDAVAAAGDGLKGKIVVDCTNPIGPGLSHGLGNVRSGTEVLQELLPESQVVKAYSVIGAENMADPTFPGYGRGKPAMLIAGDNVHAKRAVSHLLEKLGWEPVDCGPASSSLHLEHMTLLWIKMARVYGLGSHFVWSLMHKDR